MKEERDTVEASVTDVSVRSVSKTFVDFWHRPKVTAVDAITFSVSRGEVYGLLGPNGSGKSTTLKMLLGLLRPTQGEIKVLGQAPQSVASKNQIGYLPEETYLHRFLSARETLMFHGRLYGLPRVLLKHRTDELLEMVGLAHVADRPISEMSKGMTRRVGLAQALINDPQLLILDEPTSGLDPVGRRQVKDLIVELGRRNKTILLCSHLLAEVEDVCSRIGILFSGRMRAEGRVNELLKADSSLRISARAKDEQQAAQIVDCLNTTFGVLAEPADMAGQLESYFLQVIARANTEDEQVTGAEQSITLAPFLTQHASGAGGDHQAAQE